MSPDVPAAGSTVPPFDQVTVAVAPGSDLVVRLPGVLLVVAAGPPAPPVQLGGWTPAGGSAPSGEALVGQLLDLCRRAGAAGSRAPGRRLHEDLRAWLPSAAGMPSFALAAATEEGLAVALVGSGVAEVPDLGLRLTATDGEQLPDGTRVLDRLVDWPPAPLRLSAGAPVDRTPHPLADLRAGTVPGAAAVLAPAVAAAPAPAAAPPPSAPLDLSGDETAAPAPRAVELPAPALSASLLAPPDDEVRAPLPVLDTAQPPAALVREPSDTRPRVKGFLCSRGHLNDPRVQFCAMCGIRMAEMTGVLTEGVRPPLGLLLFDNGATVSLDADYLLGREPDTDERVRSGQVRSLVVVDPTGGVSRHHAEVRLEGWDVVLADIGSANGTLVAFPGATQWQSLVPHQPVRLMPGVHVRMGGRQFSFESPHGAM